MVYASSALILAIALGTASTLATPLNIPKETRDVDVMLPREGSNQIEMRATATGGSKWKSFAKHYGPAIAGGVVGPIAAKVIDKISPNKERDTILERSETEDILSRAFEEHETRQLSSGKRAISFDPLGLAKKPKANGGLKTLRDVDDMYTVFDRSEIEDILSRAEEDLEARQVPSVERDISTDPLGLAKKKAGKNGSITKLRELQDILSRAGYESFDELD